MKQNNYTKILGYSSNEVYNKKQTPAPQVQTFLGFRGFFGYWAMPPRENILMGHVGPWAIATGHGPWQDPGQWPTKTIFYRKSKKFRRVSFPTISISNIRVLVKYYFPKMIRYFSCIVWSIRPDSNFKKKLVLGAMDTPAKSENHENWICFWSSQSEIEKLLIPNEAE